MTAYEIGAYALSKHPGNPASKELEKYTTEREKWQGMISCLGRDPYEDGKVGSIDDGGAIKALYTKVNYGGQKIPPDKEQAIELVTRFGELLSRAENHTGFEEFDEAKKELEIKLEALKTSLNQEEDNFAEVQLEMSTIVALIKPIESFYVAKAYELSQHVRSV